MAVLRHIQRALRNRLEKLILRTSHKNCLQSSVCHSSNHGNSVPNSSALFVSNSVGQHTAPVQIDLNLGQRLTDDLENLKDCLKHRGSNLQLQSLIKDCKLLTELKSRKTTLEEQRETIAGMMKSLVQTKVKSDDVQRSKEVLISQGKDVRETLKALMPEYLEVEERVMKAALRFPNDLHPHTPRCGAPCLMKELSFDPVQKHCNMSHVDLGKQHGLVKFSNVGPTAYYLLGQLSLLEQTLQSYLNLTLRHSGFVQLSCPEVFRSAVVEGSGTDIHSASQVYTLSYQNKDDKPHPKIANSYHLQGVSSSTFTAFLTKTLTETSSLPHRYFCIGRNYSPTGMNYNTGLYGVTQSVQAHVFTGCQWQDDCDEVRGQLEDIAMEMYTDLQLPVRLVNIPAAHLAQCEMYRSEIQVWSQPFQQYIQVGHISMLGDYISRRLNINTGEKSEIPGHVNMVHGCLMNVTRVLAALLEHRFDQSTRSIDIPEKLLPHFSIFV